MDLLPNENNNKLQNTADANESFFPRFCMKTAEKKLISALKSRHIIFR